MQVRFNITEEVTMVNWVQSTQMSVTNKITSLQNQNCTHSTTMTLQPLQQNTFQVTDDPQLPMIPHLSNSPCS